MLVIIYMHEIMPTYLNCRKRKKWVIKVISTQDGKAVSLLKSKKKKKPTKTGHVGELRESINIGKHTCIKLSVANF